MIRAYRLVSESPHAPPALWEWEQPSIAHLTRSARLFPHRVVQRYFATLPALERANAQLWKRHYLPKPLYQPWGTWRAWLVEYRALVVSVYDIYEATHAMQAAGENAAVRCGGVKEGVR